MWFEDVLKTMERYSSHTVVFPRARLSLPWVFYDALTAKQEVLCASIRLMICQLLKTNKYPPEVQKDAIGLVLKQAEVLAEGWG